MNKINSNDSAIDCNESKVDGRRRDLLGLMSGAPLLPLAGGITGLAMGKSAYAQSAKKAAVKSVRFIGMPAPTLNDPEKMASVDVDSAMQVTFDDGKTHKMGLGYHTFFVTGDRVPDGNGHTVVTGGYYDINNKPIMNTDGSQFYSDCPDGSSLLTVEGARVPGVWGQPVFAVVQFEYLSRDTEGNGMWGKMPSPIAVLTLDQNPETGALKLVKYHNVDTSKVNGLWVTCGASLSPWGTHLSSEEYEPDAFKADTDKHFLAYSKNLFGDEKTANPYHYGHLPEVTVNPDGTGTIAKHYCVGRISHELVQAMPDERTLIMGDDTTNGGLFMFVAYKPRDLSAGSLYVGKWHQVSGKGPGAGDISWIKLGHASSDEIRKIVDSGIKYSDIMDIRYEDPKDSSFTHIRYSGKDNWVKLKPGMEKAAAYLETHRYAALKGGSMGFTKMEGTTVNIADKKAYSAMSYIKSSMIDGSTDIKVEGPKAGAIYEHILKGGQKDDEGQAINSEWVSTHMSVPEGLVGVDLPSPDALGNEADADKIANPDNIKFSEKMRTLFIGEDSGMHVNNFLWAYNVDDKSLSRVLVTPAGAESTGLHAVDDVNGWTYIMSNFQHAGDWEKGLHDKVKDKLAAYINANFKNRTGAAIGYITGMPKLG